VICPTEQCEVEFGLDWTSNHSDAVVIPKEALFDSLGMQFWGKPELRLLVGKLSRLSSLIHYSTSSRQEKFLKNLQGPIIIGFVARIQHHTNKSCLIA
jgi:hypothetical protein